jgi:CcmD family protein
MGTLILAYLVGWVAVSAYIAWLAVENGRLARRLEELEALARQRDNEHPVHAKVA